MLFAHVGRRGGLLSPTVCLFIVPFRQHQKTVLEIIIAVLHCFEWKACWPMCIGDRATVAVNSICADEQQTCQTCVRSPYCPTSCHCMTEKRH